MALALFSTLAGAHWVWTDEAGRRVYSDQPPAPDVPPARILRQPGMRAPPPAQTGLEATPLPASGPTSAPTSARPARTASAAATSPSGDDDALRQLKEENARLRGAHCARLRETWTALESGQRLARVRPDGEREVLDDAARAQERQRLQALLATDCAAS